MIENHVSSRLKALRNSAGLSVRDISLALGWSSSSYSHYELRFKGEHLPIDKAQAIAAVLEGRGVDRMEVLALAGVPGTTTPSPSSTAPDQDPCEPESPSILVPAYDLSLSAGPGSWYEHDPDPVWMEPFDQRWLRRLTASPPERLLLAYVSGDSMEPTLHDGDQILIDRTVTSVIRDGVYGVLFNDHLLVKRITVDIRSSKFTVASDNPRYDSFRDVGGDEMRIVGRIIWVGRKM